MEEIKISNTFFDLFHNYSKQIYREADKYKILIIFYIYYTL
jgi:hypothetical protein